MSFKTTRGLENLQPVINTLKVAKATFTGIVIPVGSTFVMITQVPDGKIGITPGAFLE